VLNAACLTALDSIIKRSFDMLENSEEEHHKLAAMQLYKETWLEKLDLLSNVTAIDSALQFIKQKQKEHQRLEQAILRDPGTDKGNDNDSAADVPANTETS
jgi:hypothetical protein